MQKQPLSDRSQFPMLQKGVTYFDSAATTLKPLTVIEATTQFYAQEYGTVHRAVYSLAAASTAAYAHAREAVQRFLNAASSNEIVFTKGTTEALNLVASSYGRSHLRPGDEVLISGLEHHANIVPWQLLCEEKGAHLKVIPLNEKGEVILEEFKLLLTPQTRIVSLTHISNALGTLNPLHTMIEMAHLVGAIVVVDGAQSAPHMPVDVQELNCDFFAFSGHKAFGPTGIGVLYGKYELLKAMPPYQGGGDMIEKVTFEKTTFQLPPLRFEAGTPNIAGVIGLHAGIKYIESLGRQAIATYTDSLLVYATELLSTLPDVRIVGTAAKKGPILSFVIDGIHPLDLGTLLDARRIAVRTGHLCAQPVLKQFGLNAVTRLSFAPYNTFEEIDYCIETIRNIIPLLK
jgi:cysteine desulfurase/selenocysteine lyase